MSMILGSKPAAEINVTPMIDILLVLIIIFLIIPHHTYGENALIPQPPNQKSNSPPPPERTIVVEIDRTAAGSVIKLNTQPIDPSQLRTRLQEIYKQRAEKVLFVKADSEIDFADVANVVDTAHAADPDIRVGLVTAKLESGD
jgi:biopolymer transport protein ExbD